VLTHSKLTADSPEAAKALRKQVLDKLIDQQLLVAKAVEDKLDRSPDVQMGIEASRKDVLANAYLQQASGSSSKPDDAQVRAYYSDHPELFEHRRVYKLLEVKFPATVPAEMLSSIKSAVDTGKPSDDVLKMISAGGVEVARAETQRSAEQISLDLLPRLYRLNPGQGLVTSTPQNVTIIYVKSSEESPIAQSAAMPRIAQFLTNQSLSQNVSTVMTNLRSKAKVEYEGEFAPSNVASPK
jgi:EpsD family peptidyl-prolyl cis-trans isomerase